VEKEQNEVPLSPTEKEARGKEGAALVSEATKLGGWYGETCQRKKRGGCGG